MSNMQAIDNKLDMELIIKTDTLIEQSVEMQITIEHSMLSNRTVTLL